MNKQSSENILVNIRIKPTSVKDICWEPVGHNSLKSLKKSNDVFVVDKVFDQGDNNEKIYDLSVKNIIKNVMKGYHGAIIAYGQTNSGKTYTMLGDNTNPGIIIKASNDLFTYMDSDRDFLLRVSYFEVYNEIVNDLIGKGKNLIIVEDVKKQIQIKGITETQISNPKQIIDLIKKGQKNRKIANNNYNEQSSRSHTILKIIIESQSKDGSSAKTSFLHLVDLAGSESVGKNLSGARATEGQFINKSLLTLQRVIHILSDNTTTYVPYRDSKLTRILKNSLGGNSKVNLICTISQELINLEESFITLRFATNAKKIKNSIVINESLKKDQVLQHYKDKIEELKKQLLENVGKEKYEEKINLLQRKIKKLTTFILNKNNSSDDFGLFKRNEGVPTKVREHSIVDILEEKDKKIAELMLRIEGLEKELEIKLNNCL